MRELNSALRDQKMLIRRADVNGTADQGFAILRLFHRLPGFACQKHCQLAFVAGIEALGLQMHVPEGHRLWTLNTPRVPAGVDDAKLRQYLLEEHAIEIAGGFGPLAGKVLRIGLMGYGSAP